MFLKNPIPRRATHCSGKGEPLACGSEYITALTKVNEHNWERKDYCPACWDVWEMKAHDVHWKSKVPAKKAKAPQDVTRALDLFCSAELDPSSYLVLALYLERKRVLRRTSENKAVIFFEMSETGETFAIKKIGLEKENAQEIASRVLI